MMRKKSVKIVALVLAIMMISTTAFAAEKSYYIDGSEIYTSNQMRADVEAQNHVRALPTLFKIEVDGVLYDLVDANAAYAKDPNNWESILKGEEEPPTGDLQLVLEANETEITQNAQGTAGVKITAKVMRDGVVVEDVEDMGVVEFVSTLPNLSQVQSTLENGVTTISFIPVQVQRTMKVNIRGTVDKSALEGLNTKTDEIEITVNPITGATETETKQGVTAVNATMADRVTLYFGNEVNVDDFKIADFNVWNRSDSSDVIPVKGFIPHEFNDNAIIAVLDVATAGRPMHDNTRHTLEVTGTKFINDEIKFDLEDTEHLAVVDAKGKDQDQLTVEITFSEPVLDSTKATNDNQAYRANDLAKYSIDGVKVSNMPGSTIEVGKFTTAGDERHKVTIKLPVGYALVAGNHSLQISNVGEYASTTDSSNRLITQTLNFKTDVSVVEPKAYLTQHSPEQILVTFDKELSGAPDFVHIVNATEKANSGDHKKKLIEGNLAADYTVTPITDNDRVNELKKSTYPKAVGNGYLIELNQDWTKTYNTAGTNVNYWTSTVNPYTLRIDNVEDLFGNAPITDGVNGRQEITFSIARDQVGPVLADELKAIGTPKANDLLTQIWQVEANEPLQIPGTPPAMNPAKTPSEAQDLVAGVPVPEIEFSKGDIQIQGEVVSISEADFIFNIKPTEVLEAGIWNVSIAAITDDVGNSQDTKVYQLELEGTPDDKSVKVLWADAHWDIASNLATYYDGENDWVHVKFNTDMSISGTKSVLRTQNWTVQGYALPTGSDIVLGVPFIEGTQYDAITIKLPKDWLKTKTGGDVTVNHRDLESQAGEALPADRIVLKDIGTNLHSGQNVTEAQYDPDTLIVDHMLAGDFQIDVAYEENNAYIYGHGAVLNNLNTITVGDGTDQNATVRDITVEDMEINVGNGTVTLLNVTVNGTLTITSGGINSIYINGGEINDLVVDDVDGVRIVMTNGAEVSGSFVVDTAVAEDVILDTARTVIINNLTLNNTKDLIMKSHNGAALTLKQIAERLTGTVTAVDDQIVGDKKIKKADLEAAMVPGTEEVDQAAADAVDALIAALPAAGTVTLADEQDILDARAAYDGLTQAQKDLVTNINELEVLVTELGELKGEVNWVETPSYIIAGQFTGKVDPTKVKTVKAYRENGTEVAVVMELDGSFTVNAASATPFEDITIKALNNSDEVVTTITLTRGL